MGYEINRSAVMCILWSRVIGPLYEYQKPGAAGLFLSRSVCQTKHRTFITGWFKLVGFD
jgi:hypothetical protein